jgi:hypothetical protein
LPSTYCPTNVIATAKNSEVGRKACRIGFSDIREYLPIQQTRFLATGHYGHTNGRRVGQAGFIPFEESMTNLAFAITAGILVGMGALAANADQTGVAPPQGSALLLWGGADGV